jgi:hypothetical protein
MVKAGYFLASEEFGPNELIEQAKMAEAAGFEALWISDHFHSWNSEQGNSPFVWSVIGGCPRRPPFPWPRAWPARGCEYTRAIIAQASATSAVILGGRFSLGIGTSENLNEHIFGNRWPPADVRLEPESDSVPVHRGLVLLTTLTVALVAHLLVGLPWAAAVVLGAIVCLAARHSEQIESGEEGDSYEERSLVYQRFRRELLGAERAELLRLRSEGRISNEVKWRVERDLEDARLEI